MPVFRPHTMMGRVLTNKTSVKAGQSGDMFVGDKRVPMKEYVENIETPSVKSVATKGVGLGGNIQRKLESLQIKPAEPEKRKRKPISFSL